MKKNMELVSKAGADLTKNSAVMLMIDEAAKEDDKTFALGGAAYESNYHDNMTVAHIMTVEKSGKKTTSFDDDDDLQHPVAIVLGIVLGVLVIGAVVALFIL